MNIVRPTSTRLELLSMSSMRMLNGWKTILKLRLAGTDREIRVREIRQAFTLDEIQNAIEALTAIKEGPKAKPTEAAKFTRGLMGCYRGRDFIDEEIFVSSMATVFQQFTVGLCRIAVDPTVGIPAVKKFPPAIAEVREWLESEARVMPSYERRCREAMRAVTEPTPPIALIGPVENRERVGKMLEDLAAELRRKALGYDPMHPDGLHRQRVLADLAQRDARRKYLLVAAYLAHQAAKKTAADAAVEADADNPERSDR